MKKSFRKKIKQALDNSSLRNALENLGATYPQARAKAYEGVDFEALRSEVEQVKENAIANIESLADTFEEKVRGNGGVFHRAADGREVIEIIKAIAGKRSTAGVGESSKKVGFSPPTSEERRVITCVKSKSMTSEEIELNEGLEDMMAVVETDLGEWIIQQVAEKPSHIVMPAIHLTKEKCAEIFSKAVGYKVEPDIPRMVNLARRILRDHFLKADIGISGCNIAAAQTGTMVIFTNEGNARLTSTLPPVHIVLLGYEKLVPKFKDIAATVNVLPKSATGQVITSYITMISGPAETLESGFSQTSSSEEPENKQKFFGG
ncbi:MAG: lactate utilization protein, partial [Candidatus Aminicenantes bacterium]|nr:lactate utilization protein [Candidatus Aminicenantes bacterium]